MKTNRPLLNGFLTFFVLFVVGLAVVWQIDELPSKDNAAEVESATPEDPRPSSRVFVLFIDSLRYESAMNRDFMPWLAAQFPDRAVWKIKTVHDAVTVPAIRAALTGRDRFKVLGFVTNLWKKSGKQDSILSQIGQLQGRSAVYSDGTFDQFGDPSVSFLPMETAGDEEWIRQVNQAKVAMEQFKSDPALDLVISHIGFLDYAAHKYGVGHDVYIRDFRRGDALIHDLVEQLEPGEQMIVFGDHGHTLTGRHAVGLDVPTVFIGFGDRFKAHDGKEHPITVYRHLLSHALGIKSLALPGALVDLKAGLAGTNIDSRTEGDRGELEKQEVRSSSSLFPVIRTLMLSSLVFGLFSLWATPNRKSWRVVAIPVAAMIGGYLLGDFLYKMRPVVHEPFYPTLYQIWGGVLLAGLISRRWLSVQSISWVVLLVPVFLLYPSVYRYGFTATWAPAVFVLSIIWAVEVRKDFARGFYSALLCIGVILLVQPWFFVDASNFEFSRFIPLAPEIVPQSDWVRAVITGLAFLVGTIRFGQEQIRPNLFFGSLAGVAIAIALWRGTGQALIAGVSFFSSIAVLLLAKKNLDKNQTLTLIGVASLLLFCWITRIPPGTMDFLLCSAAGLRLFSLLTSKKIESEDLFKNGWTLILFLLVAGWSGLAWTAHRLEWQFVYQVFSAKFVEANVGLFLPIIAARYMLPMVFLLCLFPVSLEVICRQVATVFSAKVLSTVGVLAAMGVAASSSQIYFEAVQHLSLLILIGSGVLVYTILSRTLD